MINIFNVEKFATHDGPGIRTTIFLKGCPLHCPWCANPESWAMNSTFMYDKRKCRGCESCVKVCPQKAISYKDGIQYEESLCTLCQKCTNSCLYNAITFAGKKVESKEIIEEVLKDKSYYENSGGGVTVSGGEPFYQFTEFYHLIKKLKSENLHVTVETTGQYSLELLKKALPYIDLFLFDIKHIDRNTLLKTVGADLNIILTNLKYIANTCPKKVIIRVPVIPGFNNSQEIIRGIINMAKELNIKEVHLLPYHSLGKNKWDQMYKEYSYSNLEMMKKEVLEQYISYGKQKDIYVKIGG